MKCISKTSFYDKSAARIIMYNIIGIGTELLMCIIYVSRTSALGGRGHNLGSRGPCSKYNHMRHYLIVHSVCPFIDPYNGILSDLDPFQVDAISDRPESPA